MIEHLFRHESGRIVSVLTRIFGSENLEMAEDVVQDSLLEALKQWTYKGIPDNPSGWIYRVAKNKALRIVNRDKYKKQYVSDVVHWLQSEWTAIPAADQLFSESQIVDDQLRMMFTCCHPSVSPDSQIALILKTLCGFSISEIARAFLTADENIQKRLVRARQKIRESKVLFEVPQGTELKSRLQTVLEAIYLLFNEGYSASGGIQLIKSEVCEEAIRLAEIIVSHPSFTDTPDVYALLALMQLNASRLKARLDEAGNILTLERQDRSVWDLALMEKGFSNLRKSITGEEISVYHILASISSYHCSAASFETTDWKSILFLYDKLMQSDPSPVVLLNRSIALAKVEGTETALAELENLKNVQALRSYHLLYSVLAEFYVELSRFGEAASMLREAIRLAPLPAEKVFLSNKLTQCEKIVL
ncbi:MAG TPA: sigma-70 family RNA polymerase sigma factor [Puia sp.]|nr:sigma-70 family RNA polymerase sigma factor [Puia sp.]